MKLDPEHQIIAAALDQAAFAEANERVVAARIEFPHEGCAKGDHDHFARAGR